VTVETVLGPVDSLDGVVDAHTHVWIDGVEGTDPAGMFSLGDETAIGEELRTFRAAGGRAVVDCMPGGAGRNLGRLARIAEATDVAIVASTGFHLPEYHADDDPVSPWGLPAEAAAERFVAELDRGVPIRGRERPVRAGAIKTAHPGGRREPRFAPLFEAALDAARSSGAAVMVHTERGQDVERLVELIDRLGFPPERVVLCHMDKRPDPGLHRELAGAGFLLEYDTFLRPKYAPDDHVWPLLLQMLEHGAEDAVACGLDLADPLMWRFGGGADGPAYLADGLRVRLAAHGLPDAAIDKVTGANIAGRLRRRAAGPPR
jgi:phosphotriesterase-related protein